MAITVDHGKVHWDDRVIDLDPDFQLKDACSCSVTCSIAFFAVLSL
jgi:hypothetical protein